jgi:N-acetylneuraminate synthase/sialic acid synthase
MFREIIIEGHAINDDGGCYLIAEIGHNHQGELSKAKELFKVAKECGAHAVKLQKRHNRSLYTRDLYDSPYNTENSYGPTYGAHREALEFGLDDYLELKEYANQLGIAMFATAFDFASTDFLAEIDVPAYKIASGDLKNTPLLKYVASKGKPIILSTGGGTLEDVKRAYHTIMPINPQLCILQCTASYPVEPVDMNLRVITAFRQQFPDVVIGLSDHQSGIAMSLIAYMLGARVIEKHFTLNRAWKGTDHAFSLEPPGLKKLARDFHRAQEALGDGVKKFLPCEAKPLYKMAKKLVAARDLPAGHVLSLQDVAIKSPGDGLPPYELDAVLGKTLSRALKEDENISFEGLVSSGKN